MLILRLNLFFVLLPPICTFISRFYLYFLSMTQGKNLRFFNRKTILICWKCRLFRSLFLLKKRLDKSYNIIENINGLIKILFQLFIILFFWNGFFLWNISRRQFQASGNFCICSMFEPTSCSPLFSDYT